MNSTIVIACLLFVVHEVATWTIGTETAAVECTAQFGLVFWMTLQVAKLVHAVSKLTFLTVFTFAGFFEWATEFGLVSGMNRSG